MLGAVLVWLLLQQCAIMLMQLPTLEMVAEGQASIEQSTKEHGAGTTEPEQERVRANRQLQAIPGQTTVLPNSYHTILHLVSMHAAHLTSQEVQQAAHCILRAVAVGIAVGEAHGALLGLSEV